MERLTTSQIQDFNNPLAFARDRSQRVGQNQLNNSTSNTVRTGDIEESYRLVLGASERLETLAGNLQTMLGLANEGQRIRGNDRKLQEVYGKLRSLSAGFDQVVGAIRFDGNTIFTGKNLVLNLGSGAQPITLETSKLLTYGDSSLKLSESEASAKASVRYTTEDVVLNDAYSLIGLDIDDASYIPGSNSALELDEGKYKVKVTYEGDNSTVELLTEEGALVEKQEEVDLSGSGREWVDFDVGVRLSFEKVQLLESIDKYDFETNGPAYVYATLDYERIEAHTLRTSESPAATEKAEFLYSPIMTAEDGGTLTASNPELSPVSPESSPLTTGNYTLTVEYRGENSYIRLTDTLGRLRGYQYGVDLTTEGSTKIDMGVGLSFEVTNSSFSEDSTLNIPVSFERPAPAIDDFDFREYAKRIESAIDVVEEERTAMADVISQVEESNQLRNLASTTATPNSLAFNSASAISILTPPSIGTNSFDPGATRARTNLLANQIFAGTTALPAQANQSPEALASLQNASDIGFVGFFT